MRGAIFLALVIMVITLSACDPARFILISPPTEVNSSLEFYSSSGKLPPFSSDSVAVGSATFLRVDSSITQRVVYFGGLGGWSDYLIEELASELDSVVLVSSTGRRVLTGDMIKKYLYENRHGLFKQKVVLRP